jgi:hypothetical protein
VRPDGGDRVGHHAVGERACESPTLRALHGSSSIGPIAAHPRSSRLCITFSVIAKALHGLVVRDAAQTWGPVAARGVGRRITPEGGFRSILAVSGLLRDFGQVCVHVAAVAILMRAA